MPFPPPPAAAFTSNGNPSDGITGTPARSAILRASIFEARPNRFGARSDESDPRGFAGCGRLGILSQESVTRVDRIRASAPRGFDDPVNFQIRFAAGRG